MKDVKNREINMVHDGYLKLMQLAKDVKIIHSRGKQPDVILIDEAQDITPGS